MTQWLKTFGGGSAEGSADMRDLLGSKGANLAEMANLGLPVPPGFTVTTELCTAYYAGGKCFPDSLSAEIDAGMRHIEETAGARFGEPDNPLLVSVRSGSRASMPGRSCGPRSALSTTVFPCVIRWSRVWKSSIWVARLPSRNCRSSRIRTLSERR